MSVPALPLTPRAEGTPQAPLSRVLRQRDPDSNVYDWSREIPEWRGEPVYGENGAATVAPPVFAGLSDLSSFAPARLGSARLTRRGRVVLVSLLGSAAATGLAVVALAVVAVGASSAGASTENFFRLPEPATVVVGEGDTLWGIAEHARPFDDPRKTVDEIVEINELPGPVLKPGQELLLPTP